MPIDLDYPPDSKPRYGYGAPAHPLLAGIIERNRAAYRSRLQSFLQYQEDLVSIPECSTDSLIPHWHNGFFPGLDAVALYCFMADFRPKRYLEIGSGNSTKFCRYAKTRRQLDTEIISVDPQPRTEVDALCDRVVRRRVEDLDGSLFDQLQAGDTLFIDSSHRVLMNSDVTALFLDILPRLRSGVLVHIHDILLPLDYPIEWAPRFYSEQYLLAAYLLGGEKFEILLPNTFVTYDPELNRILSPLWSDPRMQCKEPYGASFWMRVR